MKSSHSFNRNPLLSERLPEWRARLVLIALLAGSVVLCARAMYLQGVNKEFLQRKGESRYARTLELPANRGKVVDRHGDTLATSTPVKSIAAIPDMAQLSVAEVAQLGKILELGVADINRKLASGKDYVFLAREVPPDVAERVMALKLPGVQAQDEFRRYYPTGEMAAHLVGFTNVDDRGQEGIELAFNDGLTGKPGSRRVIKDRRGQIVEDVEYIRRPQDGGNVGDADRRNEADLPGELHGNPGVREGDRIGTDEQDSQADPVGPSRSGKRDDLIRPQRASRKASAVRRQEIP